MKRFSKHSSEEDQETYVREDGKRGADQRERDRQWAEARRLKPQYRPK